MLRQLHVPFGDWQQCANLHLEWQIETVIAQKQALGL